MNATKLEKSIKITNRKFKYVINSLMTYQKTIDSFDFLSEKTIRKLKNNGFYVRRGLYTDGMDISLGYVVSTKPFRWYNYLDILISF